MSKSFAIMAEYETPAEIMDAAKKVHAAGYETVSYTHLTLPTKA